MSKWVWIWVCVWFASDCCLILVNCSNLCVQMLMGANLRVHLVRIVVLKLSIFVWGYELFPASAICFMLQTGSFVNRSSMRHHYLWLHTLSFSVNNWGLCAISSAPVGSIGLSTKSLRLIAELSIFFLEAVRSFFIETLLLVVLRI